MPILSLPSPQARIFIRHRNTYRLKKDQLAIAQVLSVAGLIAGIAIGIFALIVMPPAAIALICWSVAFSTLLCDFLFYSINMIEILDDAQLFARCQDTDRYAQQVFKKHTFVEVD